MRGDFYSIASIRVALALLSLMCYCGCHLTPSPSLLAPVEKSIIYHPQPFPEGEPTPQDLPIEDVAFSSADGTQLHGWYVPHQEPRAIVLYCHGNAGNVTNRVDVLRSLHHDHQLSTFVFDYRGFGRSEGTPDETGILQDARAARSWLARRVGLPESKIFLMGRSLGGAVAVDLAQDGASALVLMSTFSSLPDVGAHHAPWIAPRLLMTQRMNSIDKIANYRGPLLHSHGDRDRLIPFDQGRQLFDAAMGRKFFITIDGGDHNVAWPPEFHDQLRDLVNYVRYQPESYSLNANIETNGSRPSPAAR